jgi:hypothetical protein
LASQVRADPGERAGIVSRDEANIRQRWIDRPWSIAGHLAWQAPQGIGVEVERSLGLRYFAVSAGAAMPVRFSGDGQAGPQLAIAGRFRVRFGIPAIGLRAGVSYGGLRQRESSSIATVLDDSMWFDADVYLEARRRSGLLVRAYFGRRQHLAGTCDPCDGDSRQFSYGGVAVGQSF